MGKVLAILLVSALSWAKDSSELSKKRRDVLESASFYCAIGRNPIEHSWEALNIVPNKQCRFSGPLDTKLDPKSLQPPVLNPQLSITPRLQEFLRDNRYSNTIQNHKALKDPLFHLKIFPPEWGENFTVVSGNTFGPLIEWGRAHPEENLFWRNPHFEDEKIVLPRRQQALPYMPVELVSKCAPIPITKEKSLLLIGDLHEPLQARYFLSLLQQRSFAWVGLEIDHSLEELFEKTNDDFSFFVRLFPDNVKETFKEIFRHLKSHNIKTVFINSAASYDNFPFTNVSFHGLIMGTRNLIWAKNLPDQWEGQAVLFGGLDHFTSYPGSDFQNFALERFPGLPLSLVDPFEKCASMRNASGRNR